MASQRHFTALSGVFIPTFLAIIGVIMYLRLGTILASAGVFGTILIILLAASVTLATGLSISSITTNIRIGSGGAYAIIAKTLGLEVGGSVGIPLFLAQTFSIVFYLFGFSEAWKFIFPHHPTLLVVIIAFCILFLITFISTALAVRVQGIVFVIVLASLVSIFLGGNWFGEFQVPAFGGFAETSFWTLFALFFPAVTGIMAGVAMSDELEDPKRQIPRGLMSSILITVTIYIVVVIWLSQLATPGELLADRSLLIKLSAWGPVVLAGIIAATFSQALTNLVAAPRLLYALGANGVLPFSKFFAKKSSSGEPHNASGIVALLIFAGLAAGSLDAIAPVLTMFFLISYAMVNIVVFIEQSLGLVSFRPTLKVPMIIPLYGAIGSIVFMFLINAIAGVVALIFLIFMYVWLINRKLKPKGGDVRSGLFLAVSEWAAKKVLTLPDSSKHTWKPNVLLPVATTRTLLGNYPLIKSVVYPHGTLTVLGMNLRRRASSPEEGVTAKEMKKSLRELPDVVDKFGKEGIFTSFSTVSVNDYVRGVCISLEAIESQLFHPNILFLPFKPGQLSSGAIRRIFTVASAEKVGVVLFDRDQDIGLGSVEDVHIWLHPKVVHEQFYDDSRSFDLGLLIAYRLHQNWKGKIHVWMCTNSEGKTAAENYLKKLLYEARFPTDVIVHVETQSFMRTLKKAPQGDIHIIPVRGEEDVTKLSEISSKTPKSFLFVLDSGKEDILA